MMLQSMHSTKLALGAAAILLWPAVALADGGTAPTWNFHGKNIENTADSSGETAITAANIDDLEIKWIYNIDELQGANAVGSKTRALNFPAQGVAVDEKGRVFVSTFDGRIFVLNGDKVQTKATNPDGTSIPVVDSIFDLVAEKRYFRPKDDDGDDIVSNRLHPSIDGDSIYAGNYLYFVAAGTGPTGLVPELMPPFPGSGTNPQGAVIYSIDKDSGRLNWKSIVDDHPHTMLTMSPVAYDGLVYVGLSSQLSGTLGLGALGIPLYDPTVVGLSDPWDGSCCNYQGAVAALDRDTGDLVWKVYTLPEQIIPSYEEVNAAGSANVWVGASVWGGGNPAIDTERNSIYVGTGEAYLSTTAADACETAKLAAAFPGDPMDDSCLDFDQDGSAIVGPITNVDVGGGVSHASHPLVDAVISLDKDSGEINWARRVGGYDLWSFACFAANGDPIGAPYPAVPLCPPYLRTFPNLLLQFPINLGGFGHKDLDIAEQPMLVKDVVMPGGSTKDIVLVTSKGSNVFAFDAETGADVWNTHASFGPGSLFGGGIIWGSATDGVRLYSVSTTSAITLANLNKRDTAVVKKSCPRDLFVDGVWPGGVYVAVNLADGAIAWQACVTGTQIDTATRLPLEDGGKPVIRAGNAESPISVANGVVYAGGARRLGPFDPAGGPDPVDFLTEVVALDAATGEVLRRLPMSLPGEPAAFNIRYQRPVAVGNTLYVTNGFKEPLAGTPFGVPDPNAIFSRVVAYSLDANN